MYIRMIKRRLLSIAAALVFLFVISGCQGEEEHIVEYKQISQEEAKEIMDSMEEFVILDVRTKEEYDEKHIPGAVLIPNEEILERAEAELPDKEMTILVYCRSGNRSKTASEKLAGLGYTNVLEFGGINTWTYETE